MFQVRDPYSFFPENIVEHCSEPHSLGTCFTVLMKRNIFVTHSLAKGQYLCKVYSSQLPLLQRNTLFCITLYMYQSRWSVKCRSMSAGHSACSKSTPKTITVLCKVRHWHIYQLTLLLINTLQCKLLRDDQTNGNLKLKKKKKEKKTETRLQSVARLGRDLAIEIIF